MPYIKQERRNDIDNCWPPKTAGELNYLLTRFALDYIETCGECYQTYNDIMGALEGCKLELYRRQISNYEDGAIKRNGDL